MEEALMKSGDFPNVAIKPGTNEHAATGDAVEIPDVARPGDALNESKHVDRGALQIALVRFATDWMAAAGHIQEQRTILYHTEKIAELIEGAKQ